MLITIMKLAHFNAGTLAANTLRAMQTVCAVLWRWTQQRQAAADLHAMSDYSLRDIGIARSQIDKLVRTSARRRARPTNSAGLN
ncbi:DUF1127 domain-containing protein [Bradyrhizobium sp. LjRoot220]|uniref:DUF1127 domain-containing protein n=1 Tax=Bradyrhizobium sp. LjRoot220 TaxID=3342284 RepID=UPI003ED0235A